MGFIMILYFWLRISYTHLRMKYNKDNKISNWYGEKHMTKPTATTWSPNINMYYLSQFYIDLLLLVIRSLFHKVFIHYLNSLNFAQIFVELNLSLNTWCRVGIIQLETEFEQLSRWTQRREFDPKAESKGLVHTFINKSIIMNYKPKIIIIWKNMIKNINIHDKILMSFQVQFFFSGLTKKFRGFKGFRTIVED